MSDNKTGKPVPYVRYGMLIYIFTLLISASLISTAYVPWKAFHELELRCTEPTTGLIPEESSQRKEEIYYYGPKIEFTDYRTGITRRVDAVNTVNLNKTWKADTSLAMYFNPDNPTEIILRDEHTAENHYRTSVGISIALTTAGLLTLIACIIKSVTVNKARSEKYDSNIVGQSFEEWQAQMQSENKEDSQSTGSGEESKTDA